MEKKTTACFTGHRPKKLKSTKEEIEKKLARSIDDAVSRGFDTFITGLAEGVDLWAGSIILQKKQNGEKLRLVAAQPFRNYSEESPEFREILDGADEVYIITDEICDPEDDEPYSERDRWMVDNSSLVISVYEGQSGGTRNTIEYAQKNNVEVVYLYDRL